MKCTGCQATDSVQLELNCPACARSTLYQGRSSLAQTLLERQDLSNRVERVVGLSPSLHSVQPKTKTVTHIRNNDYDVTRRVEVTRYALEKIRMRFEQTMLKCTGLRKEVQLLRERVSKERENFEERQRMFDVTSKESSAQRIKTNEFVRTSTAKTAAKHGHMYPNMLLHRMELCREAARVARLRRRRLLTPDGRTLRGFEIFGTFLPNLLDINRSSSLELTLSLNHLCRLVNLLCRYLQIRLPARILLPSGSNAYAVIFSPGNSYSQSRADLQDVGGPQKVDNRQQHALAVASPPNSRPLHVDKPLPTMAKEDPKSYALFVEGVAFLAWDIAWLCRTQGLPVASKDWKDACFIGENLWRLTIGGETGPLESCVSTHDTRSRQRQIIQTVRTDASSETTIFVGRYSQGSAFSNGGFLDHRDCDLPARCGISESSWTFASSTRFVDAFKNFLHADLSGQEWELLEEPDYRGSRDDPIVLGEHEGRTIRSKNGWTKLRPRPA